MHYNAFPFLHFRPVWILRLCRIASGVLSPIGSFCPLCIEGSRYGNMFDPIQTTFPMQHHLLTHPNFPVNGLEPVRWALRTAMQGMHTECGYKTTKSGERLLTFQPYATIAIFSGLTIAESRSAISRTCLLCYGSSPADLDYARHHFAFEGLFASLFCANAFVTFTRGCFRSR